LSKQKFETHYYQEDSKKVSKVTTRTQQCQIDAHMKTHQNIPPDGTTREIGLSMCTLSENPTINHSLLYKRKTSTSTVIGRLKNAPKLPISCLASVEHVVAMGNEVTNFVSEYQPPIKKRVMYQILVKSKDIQLRPQVTKDKLSVMILKNDQTLSRKDISVTYQQKTKLFLIEMSTQRADIRQAMKVIKRHKQFQIVNHQFSDVGLNEGLCLLNKDGSNPVHALVNIANTKSKKCFLERDAGATSGIKTRSYQDSHWTFNMFENLSEVKEKRGYSEDAYTIKISLK
jgi:hypothetical protein